MTDQRKEPRIAASYRSGSWLMTNLPYLHKTGGGVAGFRELLTAQIHEILAEQREMSVAAVRNRRLEHDSDKCSLWNDACPDCSYQRGLADAEAAILSAKLEEDDD